MSGADLNGRSLLRYFKSSAGGPGATPRLAVGRPLKALLRPVATTADRLNPADVACLSEWRNKFVSSFLNEFQATDRQTREWLVNTVGPDDTRILFMLDDLNSRTFGYMGIAFIDWEKSYVEADAIVRGGDAPPGTMAAALKALLSWARHDLGLHEIHVRVRSDNPAVGFYKKLGFREFKRVPLRKSADEKNKVTWVEDDSAASSAVQLVYMRIDPALCDEKS
ncbi:MAG TPA: GNAT family N-acetyltransferase [Verrucomicrobiae bacterium]